MTYVQIICLHEYLFVLAEKDQTWRVILTTLSNFRYLSLSRNEGPRSAKSFTTSIIRSRSL